MGSRSSWEAILAGPSADDTDRSVRKRLAERQLGSGAPIVVLHGEDGLIFSEPFLEALAARHTVHAPSHPGWGTVPRTPDLTSIDDLSYVYLDYLEAITDEPVPVVGISIGAWLAAEVAIKSASRIGALVLVSPVGIKVSGRTSRDFLDVYAVSRDKVATANYGRGPRPDLLQLDTAAFEELALAQETTALLCWRPYLHDVKLRARLRRIDVPTLIVWGEDDGLVLDPENYYRAYAELIGDNASTLRVPGVAHRIEEQAPERLAETIAEFLHGVSGVSRTAATAGGAR